MSETTQDPNGSIQGTPSVTPPDESPAQTPESTQTVARPIAEDDQDERHAVYDKRFQRFTGPVHESKAAAEAFVKTLPKSSGRARRYDVRAVANQ